MEISLRCTRCQHHWQLHNEPRLLLDLKCPSCGTIFCQSRALEDLASALEDALTQVHWVAHDAAMTITLDSATVPEQFLPKAFDDL